MKIFILAKIDEAEEDQSNLLKNKAEFNDKSRPKNKEGKGKRETVLIVLMFFLKVKN